MKNLTQLSISLAIAFACTSCVLPKNSPNNRAVSNYSNPSNNKAALQNKLIELRARQLELINKASEEDESFIGGFFGAYTKDPNFASKQTRQRLKSVDEDIIRIERALGR